MEKKNSENIKKVGEKNSEITKKVSEKKSEDVNPNLFLDTEKIQIIDKIIIIPNAIVKIGGA